MIRKHDKTFRLLSIMDRLLDGSEVSVSDLASEFDVTERTVRRDIKQLREYLSESGNETQNAIAYSEAKKSYFLIKPEREWVTAEEAESVTDILLQSGRFSKESAASVLHKIITQVSPKEREEARKYITAAYKNYKI